MCKIYYTNLIQRQHNLLPHNAFLCISQLPFWGFLVNYIVLNCRLQLRAQKTKYLCAAMKIEVLKSKVHRATITEANLQYVGSLTLDEDLMDAANMIANEKIQVVNVNNGERIETYLIKGKRGSGTVCLNGPAARRGAVGDTIIIISYAQLDFEEAKTFTPWIVFPKEGNKLP